MTKRLLPVLFVLLSCFSCLCLTAQDTAEPATVEPATAEPATTEPEAAQPATAEPEKPKTPGVDGDFVDTEEEAGKLGAKNGEFMTLLTDFRDISKTLTALKRELPKANAERQKAIQEEYMELIDKGTEIHKKMIAAALEANDEAPNRNPFALDFLYGTIFHEFNRENYEEVVRLFKKLVAHGIVRGAERAYGWAALSAITVMDTEDADAWLKVCDEYKILEGIISDWNRTESGRRVSFSYGRLYSEFPKLRKDWEVEAAKRAEETKAGEEDPAKRLPRVRLQTTKGDIVLELFEDQAPNTVANFISLVEAGFYNGTFFHRVLPQFMAQGGCPRGNGTGGPGYTIDCETKKPDARKHFRGTLSMANAGPNTNGSQFFLTFVPTPGLDGGHTVFGRVVEGMNVLSDIQRVDPDDQEAMIPKRDKIEKAEVLNKRDHEYKPKKN